jgi:hypothetical protein
MYKSNELAVNIESPNSQKFKFKFRQDPNIKLPSPLGFGLLWQERTEHNCKAKILPRNSYAPCGVPFALCEMRSAAELSPSAGAHLIRWQSNS